ncbi:MAG TPA: hypothetical protein VEL31_24615 [Ktedonobacteraceae bacterium]|nr:hypothetical protein [Ktedonobacteraceae bacterium]
MKYRVIFGSLLILLTIVLSACGGSSSSSGSQDVSVTLSDFKVSAPTTTFSAGTPYHFVVTNNGKMVHEFMILPPLAGMGSMSMDDLHNQSLVMIDSIAPGESKTVDVTFPSSSVGSSLELACHLPGHYEAGMKLPITVSN